MRFLLIFLLFITINAKEQILSNIPAATMFYVDLEPEFCDENCLNLLLQEQRLVSFVARFDRFKIQNEELIRQYIQLTTNKLNTADDSLVKVAVIIPQKIIKSYANTITKSLIAYITRTNLKIKLKFITSDDESIYNIQNALDIARQDAIRYFIMPLTQSGLNALQKALYANEVAYIPTINSSLVSNLNDNLVFGGVDYMQQIQELLRFSNSKISAFSDGSLVGNLLNEYTKNASNLNIYEIQMSSKDINLKSYFTNILALSNSSIFLNLPTIKASLISTQLKTFEIKPFSLLSTQINYNPKIINLVRYSDRENMYIANSIDIKDDYIVSKNALMDIDIRYNWLAYASSIGLEYLYNLANNSSYKIFIESIQDNQIQYNTRIFKTDSHSFLEAK